MIPKAILFDLDNTLTNREQSVTAFARLFYDDFRSQHQVHHLEDLMPIIHLADGGGYRPLDERWQLLQTAIMWRTVPTVEELRDYWYLRLGECAIAVDGLHETLSAFRDKQITLGIITNGPTGLQNHTIDALNIRQYMDCIIVSETVGIKKPSPDIFQIALSHINQSAGDVWFVGDNPATDIIGAKAIGMTTVWKRGHHQWIDESCQPDYTVDNIAEILLLL